MIKIPNKLDLGGTSLTYKKPTANNILNEEKMKVFSLRFGTEQEKFTFTGKRKKQRASELNKKKSNCHCWQMT